MRCALPRLVLVFGLLLGSNAFAEAGEVMRGGGRPARGKFLVAARHLAGLTPFAESVVLLVDHGPEGSTGLVINRRTPMKLSEALPSRSDLKERGDDLWVGGPVQPTRIMLLARAPERLPDGFPVFDEVQVIVSKFGLERAFGRGIPPAAVRAYSGHAGWSPGQLQGEIDDGDWHVTEANVRMVFSPEPEKVWDELIDSVEGRWVRPWSVPSAPATWAASGDVDQDLPIAARPPVLPEKHALPGA